MSIESINLEHWHYILDCMPNPVSLNKRIFRADGSFYDEIIYLNNSFIKHIGYTQEDILTDKEWFKKAYPDKEYRDYISAEWFRLIEIENKNHNHNLLGFPAKVTCKDSLERWFHITANTNYPISGKYHLITFVEVQTPDNTILDLQAKTKDLIAKNKELEENKKILDYQYSLIFNIINNIPIRIFWKDLDGIYLGANKLFLKDAGVDSPDEIIGKTDFELPWAKKEAQIYRDDDIAVMKSGISKLQYEEMQTGANGKQLILQTSKVPLKNTKGSTIGILGVYEDITEKRHLKNQLIEQSKLAQMGDMLNMIAHQWRQPLNAMSASAINLSIKNQFDMLSKEFVEEISEFIQQETQSMSKIIDDFMEFNKPEKNNNFPLLESIYMVKSIVTAQFTSRNISLEVNVDKEIKVFHNSKSIEHTLLNLLMNARDAFDGSDLKDKKIKIFTTIDENFITLNIQDNAGGIPQDIINKVFNPYFTTKEQGKGTGIGLYMAKQMVESIEGSSISVEAVNNCTLFKITFKNK